MGTTTATTSADGGIDGRIAGRLRALRQARGWSLEALAVRCGVSRASLSRLENAETSATTAVLFRLCGAYGLTLSRLMSLVEDGFAAKVPAEAQPVWTDPESGFRRRQVSPPAADLEAEVVEGRIPPGTRIAYGLPPRPGIEHHLVMREGALAVTVGGTTHRLGPGDCLRYRLDGESAFETPADLPARYLLFMV